MTEQSRISWRTGAAIVGGVPALVLVSLGQIASVAGGAAVLVWIVSAALGLIMAFSFAQLPRCFPNVSGGIGVLGSYAHEAKRPWLATATRWSYWLGWSPGLAVYSAVLANYIISVFRPNASPVASWLLSLALILLPTLLSYRGLSAGAAIQTVLSASIVMLLILFGGAPIIGGRFSAARLLPLEPPTGWTSWQGLAAVAGALFLAGWTCYGAELAITLAADYRRGAKDAIRCLTVVAVVTFVVYAIVPAIMTGTLGTEAVQGDPIRVLLALSTPVLGRMTPVIALVAIMSALILSVNMITMTSSRLLYQIARDEESFSFLAKRNKHDVPANALFFDGAANCLLLTIVFAVSGGRSTDVPVALLCAANVAYFVTIILSLLGIAQLEPRSVDGRRPFCCSKVVLGTLVVINVLLLACAGFAWGWRNIGIGWMIFLGITVTATYLRKRTPVKPLGMPETPTEVAA